MLIAFTPSEVHEALAMLNIIAREENLHSFEDVRKHIYRLQVAEENRRVRVQNS